MTPEEWVTRNPKRFAQIRPVPKSPAWEEENTPRVEKHVTRINSEFDSVTEREKDYGFGVMRIRHLLVNSKTGEILTENVDFAAGVSGGSIANGANSLADYKFWLEIHGCRDVSPEMRARDNADNQVGGRVYKTIREWTE